jgi:predicted 3-demethylubiquinone-9 3-methyltransferase (glyoxalase superfamily)
MTVAITPFLMFQGDGSAALDFYLATFPDSRVDQIERYGADGLGPEGQIKLARFTIGGQSVFCIDSFVKHAFTFTPSFSFWIECASVEEVQGLAETLKAGGNELMPVGNYGSARSSPG